MPLIVNCSFASMAGPQDGCSDVERRIAQFVETYRGERTARLCTVVMSAGNGLQLRAAARVKVVAERESSRARCPGACCRTTRRRVSCKSGFRAAVQERDATDRGRAAAAQSGPTGTFSKLDKALEWADGTVVYARLYHQRWMRPGGSAARMRHHRHMGDRRRRRGEPVVPAGLWHIKIRGYGEVKQTLTVDLHVHRDDVTLFARRKGRQSYFDDPYYRPRVMAGDDVAADWVPPLPGHAHVTPNGTLNAYGYGKGTVLVAGYRRSDREAAAYSSRGAETILRKTHGLHGHPLAGPDLAAVTEESPSLPGILATGTYSGTVARLNGTSVAAPLAVRALAGAIAAGGSLKSLREKLTKVQPATQGSPVGSPSLAASGSKAPEDPSLRFGDGLLDFQSSYQQAIDVPPITPSAAAAKALQTQPATQTQLAPAIAATYNPP